MQKTKIPVPAEICHIVIISVLMFQYLLLQPRTQQGIPYKDVVTLLALKIVTSFSSTKKLLGFKYKRKQERPRSTEALSALPVLRN